MLIKLHKKKITLTCFHATSSIAFLQLMLMYYC